MAACFQILRDLLRSRQQDRRPDFRAKSPFPEGDQDREEKNGEEESFHFAVAASDWATAFEGVGNSAGIGGELDAVQVARSRQLNYEFLLHPTRMRGKKQDSIAQTNRFADVVGDKDNGFAARFPNALEVAIELLAGEGVEGGEGLIHQEDAWIRGESSGQSDALFHSPGKLVDVSAFKSR